MTGKELLDNLRRDGNGREFLDFIEETIARMSCLSDPIRRDVLNLWCGECGKAHSFCCCNK